MATYKVKATYSVDVEIEIDAESEDNAISKLIQMDFRDVVEDGSIMRADSENETAEISSANYKVKVYDINYDISESDVEETVEKTYDLHYGDTDFDSAVDAEIRYIRNTLPKEMVVELKYCAPEDVEREAIDKVSDDLGWLINSASVEILEVK